MPRHFNTAGPNDPKDHYNVDSFERIDWPEILNLIDGKKFFVMHAPRQSGKTTLLRAIVERLNGDGKYQALYVNVENAQMARSDVGRGIRTIVELIGTRAGLFLPESWLASNWRSAVAKAEPENALTLLLGEWAAHSPAPIVLMVDEIDSLIGDTLVSVLRQLRTGYLDRPAAFPQAVILCGVRDVRDYRIHTSDGEIVTGGSCFNVKSESLTLGSFSEAEVRGLYGQHTAETTQVFEEAIFPRVMALTGGQPWLVNALARELTEKMPALKDRSRAISLEDLEEAKERLILRRDTHLDQLADKLREPRVRRVIEPMLQGEEAAGVASEEDLTYVADLGLIKLRSPRKVEIANEIYREIIPRALNYVMQVDLRGALPDSPFRHADGRLDFRGLLAGFQQFYRENSEVWNKRALYEEAAPQLLLQAWLQRVVNGGGRIEREYALGRRRADLFVRFFRQLEGRREEQRFVVEMKVLRHSLAKTLDDGLKQTAAYADRCQPHESHLIVVDPAPASEKSWEEKVFVDEKVYEGRPITVWGM